MRYVLSLALMFAAAMLRGAGTAPPIVPAEFFSREYDDAPYRLRGVVSTAFMDDVDPRFLFLVLDADGQSIPVSVLFDKKDPQELLALTGKRVEVTGVVRRTSSIVRRTYLGKMINVHGAENVVALGHDPDPFAARPLEPTEGLSPSAIARLGQRLLKGTVRAVWDRSEILLVTSDGKHVRVSLLSGARPPDWGQSIEVAGDVTTDTYNINLTRAVWRPGDLASRPSPDLINVRARDLLTNGQEHPVFQTKYLGETIRLNGIVRGLSGSGRFAIEDGDRLVSVDASSVGASLDEIALGCKVRVTGTCVFDIDNWREDNVFPRIRDVLVIPNRPGDVVVTAKAPWLTPARTRSLVIALLAFLSAFGVWNRVLWLRAFRRGKALSDEELAHAEADMRTQERTRLAVELHDSLVQSLSGVIMELASARHTLGAQDAAGARHVERAERMLSSCHTDLRNCLWDLRNEALEEPDMSSAIRRTLLPHVKDIALDIRFNVPRERISDNTAHIILRAVRELVLNAIRHGKASHVRIAGAIEGGVLRISVRDDGVGYDPTRAPGVLDGHFGLEGIRERLRNLSGSFDITGHPEVGTRAVLTIPVIPEVPQP